MASAAALGLKTSPDLPENQRHDIVLIVPGRGVVVLEVKASSIPTADQVRILAERPPGEAIPVLVADQIPASVRVALNDSAVSWLDRRGHLRLTGDGLYIDADVPPVSRKTPERGITRDPITGRSGLAAAAALLLRPHDPMGVSEIARAAGLNPSSITRAMTSLADAHLVEHHGRGHYRSLVPELFWALADVWPRERTTVRWAMDPAPADDGLALAASDPGDSSWVAAGVRGALEWGAPLVTTADYPVELYVPDEQVIRRVAARHQGGTGSEVRLAVDPNGLVITNSFGKPSFAWPLAHPLFCALDLTASSRDREALDQWTPPQGFTRVW
ncbi:MAG: hypothetical protein ACSLFB_04895 [Acidimicrobiales bacterium]